eukprot:Colp12_sorted_trinity150504_noHs@30863
MGCVYSKPVPQASGAIALEQRRASPRENNDVALKLEDILRRLDTLQTAQADTRKQLVSLLNTQPNTLQIRNDTQGRTQPIRGTHTGDDGIDQTMSVSAENILYLANFFSSEENHAEFSQACCVFYRHKIRLDIKYEQEEEVNLLIQSLEHLLNTCCLLSQKPSAFSHALAAFTLAQYVCSMLTASLAQTGVEIASLENQRKEWISTINLLVKGVAKSQRLLKARNVCESLLLLHLSELNARILSIPDTQFKKKAFQAAKQITIGTIKSVMTWKPDTAVLTGLATVFGLGVRALKQNRAEKRSMRGLTFAQVVKNVADLSQKCELKCADVEKLLSEVFEDCVKNKKRWEVYVAWGNMLTDIIVLVSNPEPLYERIREKALQELESNHTDIAKDPDTLEKLIKACRKTARSLMLDKETFGKVRLTIHPKKIIDFSIADNLTDDRNEKLSLAEKLWSGPLFGCSLSELLSYASVSGTDSITIENPQLRMAYWAEQLAGDVQSSKLGLDEWAVNGLKLCGEECEKIVSHESAHVQECLSEPPSGQTSDTKVATLQAHVSNLANQLPSAAQLLTSSPKILGKLLQKESPETLDLYALKRVVNMVKSMEESLKFVDDCNTKLDKPDVNQHAYLTVNDTIR